MIVPPSGPPWDLPVSRAPLAFVDLEMTGLDVARDRVVEVCVERWVADDCVMAVRSVVHPADRSDGAAQIHGITADEIACAPCFAELARPIAEALKGAVLVAHAAAWDARFLAAEGARSGVPLDVEHWLDTLALARRAFALRSHSLNALCSALGIERGRAHRAESDVRALRQVFARCVAVLEPVSVRDLWEVRVGDRQARRAIVDACTSAALRGTPVVITYRAARRPPEALAMMLLEVLADLDPPLVVGYQLPGRGRRQLRADRILRVEPAAAAENP